MKSKNKKSLNYQLGEQVGQQIVHRFLPSLSTEMIKTNIIIEVPQEESDEFKKLDGEHYKYWMANGRPNNNNNDECTRLFYIARKFHHELEKKYLPNTIEAILLKVHPTNFKKFKKGIEDTLWDSDISSYSVAKKDFFKSPKHGWCSYIYLERDEKKIPEKFA